MKRSYTIFLFALVCLFLIVSTAAAQTDSRVVFHTDFSFTAGESNLPAGTYSIEADEAGRAFISGLKPPRGGVLLIRSTSISPIGAQAAIHFVLRAGRYCLESVTLPEGRTYRFNTKQ